jgi:hypothetical protein
MSKLPHNAEELAAGFHGLPAGRKETILAHLGALDAASRDKAINQILTNGGEEGRFVGHLMSKDLPGDRGAPTNKKKNPIQTK